MRKKMFKVRSFHTCVKFDYKHSLKCFDYLFLYINNLVYLAHILAGFSGIYFLIKKQKPLFLYHLLLIISVYAVVKHGYQLIEMSHTI